MSAITFNPHAELLLRRSGGELVAVSAAAPVRGRPLRIVTFRREDDPEIVALLARIAGGAAVEAELDERAWARLCEAGLLLPEAEVPVVPAFRCDPCDPPRDLVPLRARRGATPGSAPPIVNPTLRYDDAARPPDEGLAPRPRALAGRRPLGRAHDEGPPDAVNPFAADCAWAWVEHPDAAAPGAFSIAAPHRGALRRLRPGEAPPADLDPELAAALLWADVLVAPDDLARRRAAPLVGELAGEPVKPSYAFFAAYRPGAVLEPHRDREQCAISVILLLDYIPEPDDLSPWPLWLALDGGESPRRAAAIHLGLGDGLLYRGVELTHWRDALPEGHASTSLLLHYVPEDYDGPLD